MGMDSECDLAWEAPGEPAVSWLLHRLLAEHLGCEIQTVQESRSQQETLASAISKLQRRGKRSLVPLDIDKGDSQLELTADADVIDPKEPINAEYFVQRAVPDEQATTGRRQLISFLGFIIVLLIIAALWRWTPLANWIKPEQIARWLEWFNQPWMRFAAVLIVIVIASLVMVPLSLLVVASALLLGPWTGFACSITAALLSGWIGFLLGKFFGGKLIQRLSGSQIHNLSKRLSDRGILAVAMLRLLPVAPYTVVNLAAGASHLNQGQFLVGSAIGLAPGIAALTLFSGSLREAVRNPSLDSLGAVGIIAVVIIGAAYLLRRMLKTS
jgi:uncharacterized membrane protein YdjX (TVP38/TMEM64 family)